MKLHTVTYLGVISATAIISGCGGVAPKASSDSDIAGVVAGRYVPDQELAGYLRSAGFPESLLGTMVCIAKYESGQRTSSYNYNSDGSLDYGIYQINDINWGTCGVSQGSLENPAVSARCAHTIWQMQGLHAWMAYSAHQGTCDSYRLSGDGSYCDMHMVQVCIDHNGGEAACMKKYCPSRTRSTP